MNEYTARTAMLIGEQALETLHNSRVAVIGLGGVGGHCTEALARAGIGSLHIIDGDVVEKSNLNRQLIATKKTLGMSKAEAMRLRIEAVSDCRVTMRHAFLNEENIEELLSGEIHFIVDAIDMVKAKLSIIRFAAERHIPVISAMGAGNRLDPTAFYITDIFKTEGCPLARAVRKGVREMGIKKLPVVMSRETPTPPSEGGRTPGSISFVPGAAGLILASYVVNKLIATK
jgi:tRNA A37 threonylcarbamoyladenosine dehydratase